MSSHQLSWYLQNAEHRPAKNFSQINAHQLLDSTEVNALPTSKIAKYF